MLALAVMLQRLGECLHLPRELAAIAPAVQSPHSQGADDSEALRLAGSQLGIRLARTDLSAHDAWTLVADGFPVLVDGGNGQWYLLSRKTAWRLEAFPFSIPAEADSELNSELDFESVSAQAAAGPQQFSLFQLRRLWPRNKLLPCLLAQAALNSGLSASQTLAGTAGDSHADGHGDHHDHPTPMRRLLRLLKLESRDLWTVTLFALVAGVLSLAVPLAVESLVNTVAWGNYLQPLVVLSLILFGFLSFAGLLKLLQVIIVEMLQRRLFVRIVGDLAHRFPAARRDALEGEHPAELANRYFDIMTIQKSTALLVLDGISIVLQAAIGLVLLAFYHPFLLGFDVVLLLLMTVITILLGRGGVRTSVDESKVKYRMAHWLQDVISSPTAFRLHGGGAYAVDKANRLTVAYLMERQLHFRVLARQYAFSLILLAVASTALLGVGGWLVIRGELTLGQLVASELVVTAIVSAFAKIGKSLESFYYLLAAVDKVGHMLDIPFDPPAREDLFRPSADGDLPSPAAEARIRWQNLPLTFEAQEQAPTTVIEPGTRVAITGPSGSGKSRLIDTLAGLHEPEQGFAEIAGVDVREASRTGDGRLVALARRPEIFNGSLLENVRLGRGWITTADVREVLERVNLWEEVLSLPQAAQSQLQTGGYPLTYAQGVRLMLARAIVSRPLVLLIDGIFDLLSPEERWSLWNSISTADPAATILIVTHDQRIADDCDLTLRLCPNNTAISSQPWTKHS